MAENPFAKIADGPRLVWTGRTHCYPLPCAAALGYCELVPLGVHGPAFAHAANCWGSGGDGEQVAQRSRRVVLLLDPVSDRSRRAVPCHFKRRLSVVVLSIYSAARNVSRRGVNRCAATPAGVSRSSPTLTPPIKPRSTRHAAAGLVMELAEVVYRVREVAGLTQAELARKMGTTQSAIAAIESGARTPAVELLEDRETRLGALRQALIAGESGT